MLLTRGAACVAVGGEGVGESLNTEAMEEVWGVMEGRAGSMGAEPTLAVTSFWGRRPPRLAGGASVAGVSSPPKMLIDW